MTTLTNEHEREWRPVFPPRFPRPQENEERLREELKELITQVMDRYFEEEKKSGEGKVVRNCCEICGGGNCKICGMVCKEGILEDVIVDILAFYVPQRYGKNEVGIYLRILRMLNDFRNFVINWGSWLSSYLNVFDFWHLYMWITVFHELCHHTLDDITILKGGRVKYPFMRREDEEGFCEYYAFYTTQSLYDTQFLSRFISRSRAIRILMFDEKWPEEAMRKLALSLLYYHWERDKDRIYRPRITSGALQVLEPLGGLQYWEEVWHYHIRGHQIVIDKKKIPDEIYPSIYITNL